MKRSIVIIGAGLAGSLLCNELVQFCDVTLIELGARDKFEIPEVHFVNKRLAEVPTFCYGSGGTTNLWHNGLIPINRHDIIDPVFRGVIDDCSCFTDQAASALFFKDRSFGAEYEKVLKEVRLFSDRLCIFPNGIDSLIYPKKVRKLTVDTKVNAVYEVRNISFIFEGRDIKGINYRTSGHEHFVPADLVILCAGALGTPVLLHKLMSAASLSDDSIGVGLIDHPMGFVGKVKFKRNVADVFRKLSMYDKGNYISRNAVRLKSACKRYTACAFFRPALTMSNNLSIYKYKSLLGASRGMVRFRTAFSPKLFHPDITAEILAHLTRLAIPGRIYNILFVGEQKRGRNRVFYKRNKPYVDWSISPQELDIYREMLVQLECILEELADEVNIETNFNDAWLWSMAHHSGTVSMGDTDDALVATDLRLRYFNNVFVCDGSVIQEHSYANTGLTIGQLAFRLAKNIKDTFVN